MANAATWGPGPGSPERPLVSGFLSDPLPTNVPAVPIVPTIPATAIPQDELLDLRRELVDFSRNLHSQLRSHKQRQELLLSRIELSLKQRAEGKSAPPKRPMIVSLDPDPEEMEVSHVSLLESGEEGRVSDVRGLLLEPASASESPEAKPNLVDAHEFPTNGESWANKHVSIPLNGNMHTKEPSTWSKAQQQGVAQNSIQSGQSMERERRRLLSLRLERVRTTVGEPVWKVLGSWVDWWMDLAEPPQAGRLARFVESKFFEFLCTIMVAANSVIIVYTTNYEASHLEENKSSTMRAINWGFVAFYSLELVLRLAVHKFFFFCNEEASWNTFDAVLVALAIMDLIYSEAAISNPVNVTHMRTMRSMRILRAAKVLRMFRLMRFFSELRLLLSSVLGSLISLFWGIVMLMFMFFIFALVFVQGATLAQINGEHMMTDEDIENLQMNLGSTQAGMLLLFQSTTGGEDWGRYYKQIQLTGEWNCALFLFFIAFAQFALLNILTGIFVENAMKLAEPDRDTAALLQRKRELTEAEELRRLCMCMDTTKSGVISEEQFLDQLKSEQFKARLALLGLDIKHAALFFDVVCTDFGRKEVDIEAFVSGAMRLKGLASALDLQALTFGTKLIHENQVRFFKSVDDRLEVIMGQIGQAIP